MRYIRAVLGALMLVAVASPALASNSFVHVASELKTSPVYVDPQAKPTISSADADQIKAEIEKSNDPIYIAVLSPAAINAAGGADRLSTAVGTALDRPSVVGVVAGPHFRAGSGGVGLKAGQAGSLASLAVESNNPSTLHGSITPMLLDFVHRVHAALHSGTRTIVQKQPGKSHTGLILALVFGILGAILLVVAGVIFWRARQRKEKDRLDFVEEKFKATQEWNRVQDEVLNYTVPTTGTKTRKEKATSSYNLAVSATSRADQIIGSATSVAGLQSAWDALEEAQQHLSNAQDHIEGKTPVATPPARKTTTRKPTAQKPANAPSVTVNNYQPQQQQAPGYGNYFGGGYYGGQFFGPGYYADPFWTWVEFEMLDDAFDGNDGGDVTNNYYGDDSGNQGDQGDYGSDSGGNDNSGDYAVSDDSGGGDWGGGGGDDFAGSDSGGYDSGGDFGGGDSGGGDF